MPCVLKMCSRVKVPCVLMCPRANVPTRSSSNVSCMLTCSRANVPCVFTCSRANVFWMFTCQRVLRAHVPCVLTCQCVLRAYVLTCQRVLRAYMLTCESAILKNVNSYVIQICQLYLNLKRGNTGETVVNYWDLLGCQKLLHRCIQEFRRVKNVWRKKPGKMYNVHWYCSYTQTLLSCFLQLPVLIQRH